MRHSNIPGGMALGLLGLAVAWGCGTEPTPPVSEPISVTVSPATVSLVTGGSQDFSANVDHDPAERGVNWGITGCTGDSATCGSLTRITGTTATYLAPATVPPGSLFVTATSVADPSKSFTAGVSITVRTPGTGTVYVFPPSVPLLASGTQNFAAAIEGLTSEVTWSITGCSGSADACGQITNVNSTSARYTAPPTIAVATQVGLTATSVHDPNQSTTAIVTLSTLRPSGRVALACGNGICSLNADGSGVTRLTATPSHNNGQAAWSPDGTKIAFWSDRSGTPQIFVMNADGSGVTQLTNDPTADYARPAWSPDGTRIAYTRYVESSVGGGGRNNGDIWIMNADGSGQVQVTGNPSDGEVWDYWPTWSPDGTRIAFARIVWSVVCGGDRTGGGCQDVHSGPEVTVANTDGSSPMDLTGGTMPAWSPDGTKIAFARRSDIDPYDAYVVNLDGSGLTKLTQPVANTGVTDEIYPATNYRPAWSPDGTQILFWSDRNDNSSGALFLVNADGSGVVKVTRDDFLVEGTPAWTR